MERGARGRESQPEASGDRSNGYENVRTIFAIQSKKNLTVKDRYGPKT